MKNCFIVRVRKLRILYRWRCCMSASQCGLCMPMCLTTRKNDLQLDALSGQTQLLLTKVSSEKKTGCRLLWSTVILYATLLSDSLAATCYATPGHCWTVSAQVKAHIVLKCINGVLPHLHSVIAESNRPESTLSTCVRSLNWMATCWASTKQMRMPSAGWRWRRRRHSWNEMKVNNTCSARCGTYSRRSRASATRRRSLGRYDGEMPEDSDRWTSVATLNSTRWRTGSQCSWRSTGVMWSERRVPVTRRAAFWTEVLPRCRRTDSCSSPDDRKQTPGSMI